MVSILTYMESETWQRLLSLESRDAVTNADGTFYDINETVRGASGLKQVWSAATNNYTLTRFQFAGGRLIRRRRKA